MKVCLLLLVSVMALANMSFSQKGNFGSKDPGLVNLKGNIYFLDESTEKIPENLSKRKIQGTLYTRKLDIPVRDFTEGFPGITERFEWFGIMYTGTFEITNPGLYKWTLASDDGSILWINDKQVIDNDGVHGFNEAEGEGQLSKGMHNIKVWFFQGPATELGLQLFIAPPGQERKIFDLDDYSGKLSAAAKKVNATTTKEGIRIELPNSILFDVGKYDLKPASEETIGLVADVIRSYPGSTVRIEGHTDNTGKADANKKLSQDRAVSVMNSLKKHNIPASNTLQPIGYGDTKPAASNDTEEGRSKNRRVEILIVM